MATYDKAFAVLRDVLLEDSWVLSVWPADGSLAFDLDVVLTPSHPKYVGPVPGKQHDYRRAHLVVTGDELHVDLSGAPPAIGPSDETDLGHIDTWLVEDSGRSVLEGDWGTASVVSPAVDLRFVG